MKVNILLSSNFFNDHCSYSFVFPILRSLNLINDGGAEIKFFYSYKKNIFDGDILIIDSRFSGKQENTLQFIDNLQKNKTKELKIIFADTADNSGQIKTDFLSFVDIYWKGQILKNKNEYMNLHYGGRLFTHYYNKTYKIKDVNEQCSDPIKDKKLLKKIKVCWNMGLCDHGTYSHIKQKLFSIFRSSIFISNTNSFLYADYHKKYNLSCRIETNYGRQTVEFQRKRIKILLKKYTNTYKISRFKYLNEMKKSKCVISPFGWGELCPRDFETFLNGGILIKPKMDFFETWPNWYVSKENTSNKKLHTYLSFKWDLSNLENIIHSVIKKYQDLKYIAKQGQEVYMLYTKGENSKEIFAKRFLKLIKN